MLARTTLPRLAIGLVIGVFAAGMIALPTTDAAPPRAKTRFLLYTPDVFARTETIITRKKEKKYYVVTSSKPLEFSVTGPTDLRLSSRLLYTTEMKGEQHYTLSVTDDGLLGSRQVAAYTFATRKSPISTVAGGAKLVPGVNRSIVLPVPSGRHRYQLHLSGTTAAEAAVRILIPKKDVRP